MMQTNILLCIVCVHLIGGLYMNANEFKTSYKNFLIKITKHTYNTANKYVSYINKVCSLPGMSDLWDRLAFCNNPFIKTRYVEELCDAIVFAFSDPTCTLKEKELRDGQSSAHVLLAFVSGQTWTKHKGISVQFTSIFNKNSLRSKFLSRLTTQDRIYSFGSFPINIINGMANRKKCSLFNKIVDEIKVIYNEKGDYFYFRDITRIMLATDGHAYFEKDGAIYPVFTQIPKKNPAEYCIMHAPKISDLSLDHDIPVEKELKRQINSMPTLKILSKDILNFKQAYKATHKKADNRTVLGAYKSNIIKIDEDALIKETEMFLEKLSLTIMQRNLNSSKSNSITGASTTP